VEFKRSYLALSYTAALALAGCEPIFECEHVRTEEVPSPDGKMKAALFDVNCGATTTLLQWVLVTTADTEFADAPNEHDRVAVFRGKVRVAWDGPQQLIVTYFSDTMPVSTLDSMRGIHVLYREHESTQTNAPGHSSR
jgi:hypothetical protein